MPFIHCAVCFQLCRMHQSHEISNYPRKANYRAYLYISKQTEAQLSRAKPRGILPAMAYTGGTPRKGYLCQVSGIRYGGDFIQVEV